MKTIRIPYKLFIDLLLYHIGGDTDLEGEIQQGLE